MKPLTIDELKALKVGDWVWVITADRKYGAYARVCEKFDEDNFRVETIESYLVDPYSNYGTKWLAYKNKEQAEAKGEIVELPCKVGDTVYAVGAFSCQDRYATDTATKRKIFNECNKRTGKCDGCKYALPAIEKYLCTQIQIAHDGIWACGPKAEMHLVSQIFTHKEAAEARLAELQERKK